MTTDIPVLTVDDLDVIHTESGKRLLHGISFSMKPGEWLGLVGSSGAGKTTLIHALLGLLPQGIKTEKGSILFKAMELTRASERELAEIRGKSLSIIFQDPLASLNPVLSCGVQVEEPLRIHRSLSDRDRYKRVIMILQEVGFNDPERIYRSMPRKLSGGQRQRVLLAMAIILKPQLLIADEPTSALDQDAARLLLKVMTRLSTQRDMSVLLISHNREIIDLHTDRLLFMEKGRLINRYAAAKPIVSKKSVPAGNKTKHALLNVRSVTKGFARPSLFGNKSRSEVFKNISFDVYPGEIIGIVGMSGAGKTTLGRCIAGLESIDDGEIQLSGQKVPKVRTVWRQQAPHPIQIIYQSPYASLHPHLSVGRAIEEALPREMDKEEKQKKVATFLNQVGLPEKYSTRLPLQLSGGEQQRVAIARCLAVQPVLIIADEPTASLDEAVKEQILELFTRLSRDSEMGILLISHDMESIQRTCSRVYSMQEWKPSVEERNSR